MNFAKSQTSRGQEAQCDCSASQQEAEQGQLPDFSTTSETKKEENAGTLGSTKVRCKEAATENILLSQPDKLGFGEAMKEQNLVTKN